MWWRPIDPAQERRRLGNDSRGQPGTWVQPSEARCPVPDYPAITRIGEGGTHCVKLPSMQEEKRFRNWNSALRFFEDNATPADRVRCARQERALRRGSHSQATPARAVRTKPGPRSPPPPPPAEEPPPAEDDAADDCADLGISLEAMLEAMETSSSIDTEVPFAPLHIPEGPVFTAEELETLRENECSNIAGYRGVKWYREADVCTYPFYSTVSHKGVRYVLGSHRTAEEAALHAAKARQGLQHGPHRHFERWSKQETERLIAAVQKEGCGDATPFRRKREWEAVAAHVRTRTVRQCHRRWKEAVDPNPDENQLASRKRRCERDAAGKRARREQARQAMTDGWLAATAERVGDAPFQALNEIDGVLLRADETLDPSDDFVDARRQRVTPARVFVFTPCNTKAFHFTFGITLDPSSPEEKEAEEEKPPEAQSSTLPEPKITDYIVVRKNRQSDAALKGASKLNAQRVLDLAAAL